MKASKIALFAATVISMPSVYAASPDFNYVEGGYAKIDVDNSDYEPDGLTAGIRSRVTPNIELDGGVSYIDLDDDDDTYLNLAASYYFTPAAAVSVSYRTSDDNDIMGVSARYSF